MSKTMKVQDVQVQEVGPPPVIEAVQEYVFEPKRLVLTPCTVCGQASKRSDGLCWVCRRLKLSAWQAFDKQDS